LEDSNEFVIFKKKTYRISNSDLNETSKDNKKSEETYYIISPDYVINKFNSLVISERDLQDLVSHLLNKKKFYQNYMNSFNDKVCHN